MASNLLSPLKVITQRLPWIISEPIKSVIGQECYQTIIHDLNLSSSACLKHIISKGLGLGIVLGGAIVKVPQIVKIVQGRSARGLSLMSYLLDTAGLGITVAYNLRMGYSWSSYGENVFLLAQNVVITYLIVHLSTSANRQTHTLLFFTLLTVSLFTLFSPLLPTPLLQTLAALTIPLTLSSKLPQILSNHAQGSTGQLSAFLVFNSFVGCAARVYTTVMETGDRVILVGFLAAMGLNGVLAAQMGYYWNVRSSTIAVMEREKEMKEEREELEKVLVHEKSAPSSPVTISTKSRNYVRKLD